MKRTPSIIPEWRWEALIRAYTTLRGVPTPPPVRRSSSTTLQAQGDSLSHRPSECHICRRRRLPVPSGYPHRHPTPYTQRPTPQSSDGPRGGNRGRSCRISPVTHAITVKRVSHHRLFRAQDQELHKIDPQDGSRRSRLHRPRRFHQHHSSPHAAEWAGAGGFYCILDQVVTRTADCDGKIVYFAFISNTYTILVRATNRVCVRVPTTVHITTHATARHSRHDTAPRYK